MPVAVRAIASWTVISPIIQAWPRIDRIAEISRHEVSTLKHVVLNLGRDSDLRALAARPGGQRHDLSASHM